jgi:hypothetical protein
VNAYPNATGANWLKGVFTGGAIMSRGTISNSLGYTGVTSVRLVS